MENTVMPPVPQNVNTGFPPVQTSVQPTLDPVQPPQPPQDFTCKMFNTHRHDNKYYFFVKPEYVHFLIEIFYTLDRRHDYFEPRGANGTLPYDFMIPCKQPSIRQGMLNLFQKTSSSRFDGRWTRFQGTTPSGPYNIFDIKAGIHGLQKLIYPAIGESPASIIFTCNNGSSLPNYMLPGVANYEYKFLDVYPIRPDLNRCVNFSMSDEDEGKATYAQINKIKQMINSNSIYVHHDSGLSKRIVNFFSSNQDPGVIDKQAHDRLYETYTRTGPGDHVDSSTNINTHLNTQIDIQRLNRYQYCFPYFKLGDSYVIITIKYYVVDDRFEKVRYIFSISNSDEYIVSTVTSITGLDNVPITPVENKVNITEEETAFNITNTVDINNHACFFDMDYADGSPGVPEISGWLYFSGQSCLSALLNAFKGRNRSNSIPTNVHAFLSKFYNAGTYLSALYSSYNRGELPPNLRPVDISTICVINLKTIGDFTRLAETYGITKILKNEIDQNTPPITLFTSDGWLFYNSLFAGLRSCTKTTSEFSCYNPEEPTPAEREKEYKNKYKRTRDEILFYNSLIGLMETDRNGINDFLKGYINGLYQELSIYFEYTVKPPKVSERIRESVGKIVNFHITKRIIFEKDRRAISYEDLNKKYFKFIFAVLLYLSFVEFSKSKTIAFQSLTDEEVETTLTLRNAEEYIQGIEPILYQINNLGNNGIKNSYLKIFYNAIPTPMGYELFNEDTAVKNLNVFLNDVSSRDEKSKLPTAFVELDGYQINQQYKNDILFESKFINDDLSQIDLGINRPLIDTLMGWCVLLSGGSKTSMHGGGKYVSILQKRIGNLEERLSYLEGLTVLKKKNIKIYKYKYSLGFYVNLIIEIIKNYVLLQNVYFYYMESPKKEGFYDKGEIDKFQNITNNYKSKLQYLLICILSPDIVYNHKLSAEDINKINTNYDNMFGNKQLDDVEKQLDDVEKQLDDELLKYIRNINENIPIEQNPKRKAKRVTKPKRFSKHAYNRAQRKQSLTKKSKKYDDDDEYGDDDDDDEYGDDDDDEYGEYGEYGDDNLYEPDDQSMNYNLYEPEDDQSMNDSPYNSPDDNSYKPGFTKSYNVSRPPPPLQNNWFNGGSYSRKNKIKKRTTKKCNQKQNKRTTKKRKPNARSLGRG